MGVRPDIFHCIGIELPGMEDWYHKFEVEFGAEGFWEFTKDIWQEIEKEQCFLDKLEKQFKNVELVELMGGFFRHDSNLITLKPPFQFRESSLYNHSLIWAMIEGAMIQTDNRAMRIPYDNWEVYRDKDLWESAKSIGLMEARDFKNYMGSWFRKYPHSPLDYFDSDLDFANLFFKKLGIDFDKSKLDRFVIFEWC